MNSITKKCLRCEIVLPIDFFNFQKYRGTYKAVCKKCLSLKRHKKRCENIDEVRRKDREARKIYVSRHRDEVNKKQKVYQRAHYPERANDKNAKIRARRVVIKQRVIDAYGGGCACCGETHPEFLAVDHINGNGNKLRKAGVHSTGAKMYAFIIRNNFPEEFRILCHNCNQSLANYKYCPHNKE